MKNQLFVSLVIFGIAQAIPNRVQGGMFENAKGLLDNMLSDMKTPKEALMEIQKIGENMVKLVNDGEEQLSSIYVEIAVITRDEANLTKDVIQEFINVKSDLRIGQQELRILAEDIVGLSEDIAIMVDHEEDISEVEVEITVDAVKQLFERSRDRLTNAKNQYVKAVDHLAAIRNKMNEQIKQLNELTDENSKKYKEYESKVNENAFGGCGIVSVGMMIADIMGCSGTCTTSNSSLCWEAVKPSVEFALKKYKEIVEDFKQKTTDANDNILNLENTVQDAVSIFENKIGTINECQVNFENLEKEQYKYQILGVSSQQRKELVSIANELNEFATEFLSSQPSFFRKMSTNTEQNVVDQSAEENATELNEETAEETNTMAQNQ